MRPSSHSMSSSHGSRRSAEDLNPFSAESESSSPNQEDESSESSSYQGPSLKTTKTSVSNPSLPELQIMAKASTPKEKDKEKKKKISFSGLFNSKKKKDKKEKEDPDSPRHGRSVSETSVPMTPRQTPEEVAVRANIFVSGRPTISPRMPPIISPRTHVRQRSESLGTHRKEKSPSDDPVYSTVMGLEDIKKETGIPEDTILLKKGDGFDAFAHHPLPNHPVKIMPPLPHLEDPSSAFETNELSIKSTPPMAPQFAFNPDQYDKINIVDNARMIQTLALTKAMMNIIIPEEEETSLLSHVRETYTKKKQDTLDSLPLDILAKDNNGYQVESFFDKIEAKNALNTDTEPVDSEMEDEIEGIISFMATDIPEHENIIKDLRSKTQTTESDSESVSDSESSEEKDTPIPALLPPICEDHEEVDDEEIPSIATVRPMTPRSIAARVKGILDTTPTQKKKKKKQDTGLLDHTEAILAAMRLESAQRNKSIMGIVQLIQRESRRTTRIEQVQNSQNQLFQKQQEWQRQFLETIKQMMQAQASKPAWANGDIKPTDAYKTLETNYVKITQMLQTMLFTLQTMSETVSKYQLELAVVQRVSNQQQQDHTRILNLFEEKFKNTTDIYENNKKLLTGKIRSLKNELKDANTTSQNLSVELTNERNLRAGIMKSIQKKGKSISIEYVTEEPDEPRFQQEKSRSSMTLTKK